MSRTNNGRFCLGPRSSDVNAVAATARKMPPPPEPARPCLWCTCSAVNTGSMVDDTAYRPQQAPALRGKPGATATALSAAAAVQLNAGAFQAVVVVVLHCGCA